MTEREWPDWVREASRGSLSSTRGTGTWSISEIPANDRSSNLARWGRRQPDEGLTAVSETNLLIVQANSGGRHRIHRTRALRDVQSGAVGNQSGRAPLVVENVEAQLPASPAFWVTG